MSTAAIANLITCSICLSYPTDPVMLQQTGQTYCRSCITSWLQNNNTCPLTKAYLHNKTLIPNRIIPDHADVLLNSGTNTATAAPQAAPAPLAPIVPTKPILGKTANGRVLRTMGFTGTPKKKCYYFLIDTSGSTSNYPNDEAKQASITLLDIIIHTVKAYIHCLPQTCSFAIYSYSTHTTIQKPPSYATDVFKIQAFNILKTLRSSGTTDTLGGIITCLDALLTQKRNDLTENIIVHFTDGLPDNKNIASALTRWRIDNDIQDFPAKIINIGFGDQLELITMTDVATLTGGRFLHIPSFNECASVFLSYLIQTVETAEHPLMITTENGPFVVEISSTIQKDYLFQDANYTVTYNGQPITDFELIAERAETNEQFRAEIISAFAQSVTEVRLAQNMQAIIDKIDTYDPALFPEIYEYRKDISGQIMMATSPQYYNSWGKYYLAFIKECYMHQVPGNDKDFGMKTKQMANYDTLYFDALDKFNTIPFVKISPVLVGGGTYSQANAQRVVSNSSQRDAPCVSGTCTVILSDGTPRAVAELNRGDVLQGGSIIDYITIYEGPGTLYKIGDGLRITGTHPIRINGEWIYPYTISQETMEEGRVYNIILKNREPAVVIEGVECITLAHGLTEGITEHDFYGTERIVDALLAINTAANILIGHLYFKGIVRNPENGWVCGVV